MKIDRITISRVHGLPLFSNIKLEISLMPDPDESPDEAFEKGRIFIKAKLRLLVDTVDTETRFREYVIGDEDEDDAKF